MAELEDSVHEEIVRLSQEGDQLVEAGAYDEAIKLYGDAWRLLPEPQQEWDAALWLLAAIGDASFLSGKLEDAKNALQFSLSNCPGALGNPFLHFRLGQTHFELSELDRAADELMRAYMGAGEEIFQQHDPKYRNFLATRANLDN
jgi:tetratricopeptide (TPR) repeat protein